mmetsp:Transcript_32372/g.77359  ORF Transcript_32372/g.77359 Transcript_32372/m.77359 type:complete len:505 (-) Transcript_32372:194-1708(-)
MSSTRKYKTAQERRTEAADPRKNRPLNRFNLYYILERERLLQSSAEYKPGQSNQPLPPGIITGYEGLELPDLPPRYSHLELPKDWFVPGKRKLVRRSHRKNHGLISFKEIAQVTADNWKTVDTETFDFVTKAAKIIADRYKEIEQALGAAPVAPAMPPHAMMHVAPPVAYHPFLQAPGVYAAPTAARSKKTRGSASKAKKAKGKRGAKKAGGEPQTGEPLGLGDAEGFWNVKNTPPPHDARGSLTLVAPPGTAMEGRTLNLPNINSNAFGADLNVYRSAYHSSLNGMVQQVQQMHAGNQANALTRSMPMAGAPDSNPFLLNGSYYQGLAASNAHAPMNYSYPGMPPSNPNNGMYLPHLHPGVHQGGLHGAMNGMNAMPAYGAQPAHWAANQGGMFANNRIQPTMPYSMPPSRGPDFSNRNPTLDNSNNVAGLQGGPSAAAPAPSQLNIAGAPAALTEATHTLDYSESTGIGEGAPGNGKKTDASNSSQVAINDSDILHMLKKDH